MQVNNYMNTSEDKGAGKTAFIRVIFWCANISILMFATMNQVVVYVYDKTTTQIVFGVFCAFTMISLIISTIQNAKNFKQAVLLYLLLDNTSIILTFTLIAWNYYLIALNYQVFQSDYYILIAAFYSINFFLLVGNFRVLIKRYNWSKCQVIMTKIFLILGASAYTHIACYFMVSQGYQYDNIADFDASLIKDFSSFYAISVVALYYDLFGKLSNLDGTNDHKYHYTMKDNPQSNSVMNQSASRHQS